VTVLEDDPYGELRYRGQPLPPVAGLDARAPIIHLGSFSKTLAPGLRLGYAVADERTIRALTIAKQAADLHSGQLAQTATARLLSSFDYDAHLSKLRALYGARLDAMLTAVARSLPRGSTWTEPEGGLFVWAKLPTGFDAQDLLQHAMLERVAFVPGAPFYPRDPERSTLRLNFSNRPPELIAEGIARLGGCIQRLVSDDRQCA
jgi:2-aminoadipate transaminase